MKNLKLKNALTKMHASKGLLKDHEILTLKGGRTNDLAHSICGAYKNCGSYQAEEY